MEINAVWTHNKKIMYTWRAKRRRIESCDSPFNHNTDEVGVEQWNKKAVFAGRLLQGTMVLEWPFYSIVHVEH